MIVRRRHAGDAEKGEEVFLLGADKTLSQSFPQLDGDRTRKKDWNLKELYEKRWGNRALKGPFCPKKNALSGIAMPRANRYFVPNQIWFLLMKIVPDGEQHRFREAQTPYMVIAEMLNSKFKGQPKNDIQKIRDFSSS